MSSCPLKTSYPIQLRPSTATVFSRTQKLLRALCILACLCVAGVASASEHHGQVTFNGLPVPGATVTATQGTKKFSTISNEDGSYAFTDLPDGTWHIAIEMLGFAKLDQDVTITPTMPRVKWELKMLSLDQILAQTRVQKSTAPVIAATAPKPEVPKPGEPAAPEPQKAPEDANQQPSDGFLVNGSVNNAATSQFTIAPAFGNTRSGTKGLYTGSLGLIVNSSVFDAQQYSVTGSSVSKPSYTNLVGVATIGGPIKIPHLLPRGPNFFIAYQWTRDSDATTFPALVPTLAQRNGNFTNTIYNPATGLPYAGSVPISPQAQALLNLYPLPNVTGNVYNYEVPVLSHTHQDAMQSRLDKTFGQRNQVYGGFAFQSTRSNNVNLFGFVDSDAILGINTNVNWSHRFNHHIFTNLGFTLSRLRTSVTPYFANRQNISGAAGITGNSVAPSDWGPPALSFSSGIASLSDGGSVFNRNRTDAFSASASWYHDKHNFTFGGDFRRPEFNILAQSNPRGSFNFTGTATQGPGGVGGDPFADFLVGVPDASQIAFGNADKYFRQSIYDAYATDDWRLRPELTINAGIRWEYGSPMTELKNRLVNLDVSSGFTNVQPVLATSPVGSVTGSRYPSSLIHADHLGIEPRVGLSWRPIPGSTLVVRAGYGVYDDTSVYQSIASAMAQQAPLPNYKSFSVANSSACPLTLANGFNCASVATFGIDPNFRVGYAQTWQLAVQRDLPGALQMTVTYLGVKGTRGVQTYLPNTYPLGATNPCPSCFSGFTYRSSNGNSRRESGSIQLRRRLRSGFTASAQYTFSKSMDDDSVLGGQGPIAAGATSQNLASGSIAQNWLNLSGERSLSNFDQRHLLSTQFQYTSGMGLGGGSLMTGWRGRLLKDWTVQGQITAGTGLPETPIYYAITPGSGVAGWIRPNRTTASIYAAPAGKFLNAAAYTTPTPGQWGNAGRNSITGPGQLSFNASLARTFRLNKRFNLDFRVDSSNVLNHVVFSNWNNITNSSQFGAPGNANSMRSMQATTRLRF
jgi:hypothetical protein